ncbi:MAG: ATP synthase subunit I [Nitrincola sp.]|nr:ATP synthase subunit I [Nitrincola sp.]
MELNILDSNNQIESVGLAKKDTSRLTREYTRSQAAMLLVQLAIFSIISLLIVLIDFVTAYSVMLGGFVYIIPAAWFVLRIAMKKSPDDPHKFLAGVYIAKAGMLVLTVALFCLVYLTVEPLNGLAFIAIFIVLQMSSWYLQINTNNRFLKL